MISGVLFKVVVREADKPGSTFFTHVVVPMHGNEVAQFFAGTAAAAEAAGGREIVVVERVGLCSLDGFAARKEEIST